jgi:hypothetical protein
MRRCAMSVRDDMGVVRNDCVDMVMTYTKFIAHQTPAERRAGDAFHVEDGSFCKCGLKVKINKDDAMSIHTGI